MAFVIRGRVQAGTKRTAHWLLLFNGAYAQKLGMPVFPGSLNLALDTPFDWFDTRWERAVIEFPREEYGGERDILLLPCSLSVAPGLPTFLWSTTNAARDLGELGRSADNRENCLMEIREEQPGDVEAVRVVNRQAFGQEQEGRIVDALREHRGVLLSLVAVAAGTVVGHILFSPVTVGSMVGAALGPMAVLPEYQRQGIGSRLVEQGIERLRGDGCPFIVVIGHPEFYPRFGFQPAGARGLSCEWEVPAEAFLVTVLNAEVGAVLGGLAKYRAEFSTVE